MNQRSWTHALVLAAASAALTGGLALPAYAAAQPTDCTGLCSTTAHAPGESGALSQTLRTTRSRAVTQALRAPLRQVALDQKLRTLSHDSVARTLRTAGAGSAAPGSRAGAGGGSAVAGNAATGYFGDCAGICTITTGNVQSGEAHADTISLNQGGNAANAQNATGGSATTGHATTGFVGDCLGICTITTGNAQSGDAHADTISLNQTGGKDSVNQANINQNGDNVTQTNTNQDG
ncbi:hypothetical protein [Streptomyces sp. NPDC088762]|uniref:hypothetical protein n=1 Tax=Streptomyces sp. NPDC088762 TaxID=3365891 RepID=UPI003821AB29